MATPTDPRVLESLRALAGMGMSSSAQNPSGAVMGRVNQDSRLSEMKRNIGKQGDGFHAAALPFDVQDLQGDMAADTDFGTAQQGRIGHIQELNNAASDYARPDVAARRAHDEATKLQLTGEPARVAGAANLESAKVAEGFKSSALSALLGAAGNGGRVSVDGVGSVWSDPSVLQGQKDDAASARIAQTSNAQALRDRQKAIETGKAHAANSNWFGIGQKAADDAEVASIQKQLLAGGQDSSAPRPGQAAQSTGIAVGTRRIVNGTPAEWDGHGWAPTGGQ